MGLFRWLVVTLIASAVSGYAVPRLPVEEFSRTPSFSRARLSPDGSQIAFIADHNGRSKLHVLDVKAKSTVRINLGEEQLINGFPKEVEGFTWVGNRRLLVSTTVIDALFGVIALDSDGRRTVGISGLERPDELRASPSWAREVVHVFYDDDATVLMLDRHESSPGRANRPDVITVNTRTGLSHTILKNPGQVGRWGFDFAGVARLGFLSHGDLSGLIYRESQNAPWQTVLPLKDRRNQYRMLGFDAARNQPIVAALTENKRWAPFPLNAASGELGSPLLTDTTYDIIPELFVPAFDGVALAGPIFSQAKRSMVGFRYYTEAARVKWFDKEFSAYQQAVDKSRSESVNLLVDQSVDGKRLLWFSFSDQNSGAYYLLDTERRSFEPIATRMPWIKPEQMAPMLAVKYPARDGLEIHGYLTVPVGYEPKNLPLVVMPHGGPWVRNVWGFDPLVQLLANRGYAVLQMNYRGSTGYGDELYQQAKREIGGKIQDDIEDATRWAIKAGVADPKRIAIMGMSYGGYSTLFGLGHNPELYRCGISIAGVTDWPALYEDGDVAENKAAKQYWLEQIGDPNKDDLRKISPIAFADKINAPVLIIQGKKDQRVPQDQAKRMIAALEKHGRKPESLFLADVGHNFGNENKRTEIFTRITAFLETNLGPGVP
jgi:dipeptidyl aminopeptidase/acylaminoacyl peptidase